MKLAYFSPLPPRRTGIADYSRDLLLRLKEQEDVEIDLWIDSRQATSEIDEFGLNHVVYPSAPDLLDRLASYDLAIYQMGNNEENHGPMYEVALTHPGLLVLHDYVLHHFLAWRFLEWKKDAEGYVREMAYAHGEEGERIARDTVERRERLLWTEPAVIDFPLNARVVRTSRAVVTPSRFAAQRLRLEQPDVAIHQVELPVHLPAQRSGKLTRQALGIPAHAFVVGSFGFLSSPKRIPSLLKAIHALRGERPVHCLLVGEVRDKEISALIRDLHLEDTVQISGYVSSEEYQDYLSACDTCVNLRFPITGEASASVCGILAAGKPCVVSNIGWFGELPDGVIKIPTDTSEVDALIQALRQLSTDDSLRQTLGLRARAYITQHHDPSKIANTFVDVCREVIALS